MSSDECNLFRKNGTISFAIKSTSFSNHVGRSKLNCKWWIQSWAAVWARVDLGFFVEPAPMDFWAKQRCERIDRLTSSLYFALIHDDGGLFVGKTGSLVSGSNLRTRRNQKIFDIILDAEKGMSSLENDRKRFWTKKIMFESIRSLVSKYNVQVPQVPGFSWTNWFKDQSSTLHELVKRAKRNRRNMDCLQTLPFNPEEPQHVLDLLCDSKVPSLISAFLWSITFCSTIISDVWLLMLCLVSILAVQPSAFYVARSPLSSAKWRLQPKKFLGSSQLGLHTFIFFNRQMIFQQLADLTDKTDPE